MAEPEDEPYVEGVPGAHAVALEPGTAAILLASSALWPAAPCPAFVETEAVGEEAARQFQGEGH